MQREPDHDVNRASGPTAALSAFVANTPSQAIPDAVRYEAKRALVNYFAVALAGCGDVDIGNAVDVYSGFSSSATIGLIGRTERTDVLNAAALNAMTANVHDFDDTHLPTIIHPTAPVAAALFALAEDLQHKGTPLSGERFLTAFVLGVEVECRIGNAVSPGHYRRGWHITSTCGVFGAAAAAAHVMCLDATRIGWAMGHASAQAGGLVETLGSMSKSVSVGNAARNGVVSALLAARDVRGPAHPLEGERGFLRVTCDEPDFSAITTQLGHDWALQSNAYKPYPCGVVLNPVIDACLALARDEALKLDEIARVELTGHPLLRARTDRPNPKSGREAQVSAQHAVAVALATGRAGLAEFSDAAVADPALSAFGARVAFVDDPQFEVESAQVVLHLVSGRTLACKVDAARGSLAAPLTDHELEAKLATLAAYGGSTVDPQPLLASLWSLDAADDASTPMRAAQPTLNRYST
ncbi:MmgE/PrpD family protein [Paraburkholderia flava]|uniref:MmgE/PrpD family protein n=1 Tax=Paraburkholderia flava TaxID=2547393 RepID=UPI001060207D|nr:MmgE/PrpD family protein [Paraburkholderia flava]